MDTVLPWHRDTWRSLVGTLCGARPPHALLIHGPAGTGVQRFAECVASAMVCESPTPADRPCGHCAGCALHAARSHPDLLRVRPAWIARAEASGATDDDGDAASEGEGEGDGNDKGGKRAGRSIAVEDARAVARLSALASHRGGWRVALMYPAEAMRHEAANTLLKTLEEPTPRMLLILVAASPDALLPTIVSRCHRVALPRPTREAATAWLQSQTNVAHDVAAAQLAASGDAPLDVVEFGNTPYWETHAALLDRLAAPRELDPIALARTLEMEIKRTDRARQQGEPASVDLRVVVGWLQRWVFDVISRKASGTVRYHPARTDAIDRLPAVPLAAWIGYADALGKAARDATHPVNTLLFLEDVLARYVSVQHADPRRRTHGFRP